MAEKLYLIIRRDLPAGAQLAQVAHGMRQFTADCPEHDSRWYRESNTVAVLHARDALHLEELHAKASALNVPAAMFREPDLGDAPTCLALGAGASVLTRKLPLAA